METNQLENSTCNRIRQVHLSNEEKARVGMSGKDMILDDQNIVYQSNGRTLTISHFNPLAFCAIPPQNFSRVISVEVPWDILNHKHYSVRGSNGRLSCREEVRTAKIDHKIHGEMYLGKDGVLYKQADDDGVCERVSKRSCKTILPHGLVNMIKLGENA